MRKLLLVIDVEKHIMKKLVTFVLLIFFFLGCATTQNNQVKKYSNLTADKVRDNCEPNEVWSLRVMGIGALAAQFDNCMGIKTLLTIAIPADIYSEKVRRTSLDLLVYHYALYLKNIVDKTKIWSVKKIKEEIKLELPDQNWLMFFYSVTSKQLKCVDNVCTVN